MSGGESVDRLRQAAAQMRALAAAATGRDAGAWRRASASVLTSIVGEPDAAYIAAMHPAVALAVADWLDFVVAARDAIDFVAARDPERGLSGDGSECFKDMEKHALAVADAFLGSL